MTEAKAIASNIPVCTPKARPMNISSSTIAVSKNAVLNVFPIILVELVHLMLRVAGRCIGAFLGKFLLRGVTLRLGALQSWSQRKIGEKSMGFNELRVSSCGIRI